MALAAWFILASPGQSEKKQRSTDQKKSQESGETYLSTEQAKVMVIHLCDVPITDCRDTDLTFPGLLKVLNRNLASAQRRERVFWPDDSQPSNFKPSADYSTELEMAIKIGNPWGPFSKAKGHVNWKKLAEQINHGSVYDLINNITLWCGNEAGCFSDGVHIQGGENWPRLPDKGLYPLVFQ